MIVKRALPPHVVHIVADSNVVGVLTTRCVGVLSSVYRLGMGMLRQGSFALLLQGWINLDLDMVTPDSLDLLDEYWHALIVLYFHLKFNTCKCSLALLFN